MYKNKKAGHPRNAYSSRDNIKKQKVSNIEELCAEIQTFSEIRSNLYSLLQVGAALRSKESL